MWENEYGSARRWEFSLLQMLVSQKPNRPSGPKNDRPMDSSIPATNAKMANRNIYIWARFKVTLVTHDNAVAVTSQFYCVLA